MASQVDIRSLQPVSYAEVPDEPGANPRGPVQSSLEPSTRRIAAPSADETFTRELRAQGLEFVARPGQQEKLQKAIRQARRSAQGTCDGFAGCLVFVSEQEERLVTLVTLWDGTEDAKKRDESSERFKRLLEPYVDRWLRTGRFVTSLTMLDLPAGFPQSERPVSMSSRAACH